MSDRRARPVAGGAELTPAIPRSGTRHPLWILCRVVDNFGDVGVCWRLARELAAHHPFAPTLVIDHPQTLAAIEPRLAGPGGHANDGGFPDDAQIDGVRILARARIETVALESLPTVIISAFGCAPPDWLRACLAGGPRQPLWVQLEYLSAEDWVESCHALVSVKPTDSAREHFLYPGFTERTAGLLREHGLLARRDAFRAAGGPAEFLAGLGASPTTGQRVFSLFCYPTLVLDDWFDELATGPANTLVCIAGGSADAALRQRLGRPFAPGERHRTGQLELIRLPMLSQDDYDRLLWSCAFNAVRGEDSWLRAHWAGVPFAWQAYPQADGAQQRKLDAFLARMGANLPPRSAADQSLIDAMMHAWNDPTPGRLGSAWRPFDARLAGLGERYRQWSESLARQSGLAERLSNYCLNQL